MFSTFFISQRAISANITNMTKAQAKTWCENYMNSSPAFLACQDIPNTNSTRAIEICVMDILVSENCDQIFSVNYFIYIYRLYSICIWWSFFSYTKQTTNSTVFAAAPREIMKAGCLKEIARNDTLLNVTKNGEKIADKILSIACPGECSGHGVCTKGIIKKLRFIIYYYY